MDIKSKIASIASAIVVAGGITIYQGTLPNVPEDFVTQNEIVEKRTENVVVFKTASPGVFNARAHTMPIHYKDGKVWKKIDTTVKAKSFLLFALSERPYEVVSGTYHAEFPAEKEYNYKFTKDNTSIAFTALFDASKAINISIETLNTGIKETIILSDATAPTTLQWRVETDGTLIDNGDGGFSIRDSSNIVRMQIPPPTAFDDAGKPVKVSVSSLIDTVTFSVSTIIYELDVTEAIFPVTLDPTTQITGQDALNGYVHQTDGVYLNARNGTGSSTGTNILAVGQIWQDPDYFVRRSFLCFPDIPSQIVVSACSLCVDGDEDNSVTDFNIDIVGARAWKSVLAIADFRNFNGWAASGTYTGTILNETWGTASYSANWNKIVFNASGFDSLETAAGDSLWIAMLSSRDYDPTTPTGNEYVYFTPGTSPYISFTYTTVPNAPTGLTNASVLSYRRKITTDYTKVDSTLTNFPALVLLTASNFDFNKSRADGKDVYFTDSNGAILDFQRVSHSAVIDTAEYWVDLTTLSHDADVDYYVCYGDTNSTTDYADPAGTWDANFVMVQHLSDSTTSKTSDATSNGNFGTKKGANEPIETGGKINRAQSFDGTDDIIDLGNNASIQLTNVGSLSALVKRTSTNTTDVIVSNENFNTDRNGYTLAFISTNKIGLEIANGSTYNQLISTSAYTDSTNWYLITGTWDGSTLRLYRNTTALNTLSQTINAVSGVYNLKIGKDGSASAYHWKGLIDELRVSNIARSAAWIKAEYYSNVDSLLSYDVEEDISAAATTTSLSFTWTDNSDDELGFHIKNAGGDTATVGTFILGSETGVIEGLGINTRHGLEVRAFNAIGWSAPSDSVVKYTLANPPTTWNFTLIGATGTVDVGFGENSNPATTTYAVRDSTNQQWVQTDGTLGATIDWDTYAVWDAVTITDPGVTGTVRYSVMARNGDNVNTSEITNTLYVYNMAPTSFDMTVLSTTSMRATWTNASSNYDSLLIMNSPEETGVIYAASGTATTVDKTGLSINTLYTWFVRADSSGTKGDSDADSLYTLANPPTTWAFTETSLFNVTPSFNGNSNPAATTYAVRDSLRHVWISATGTTSGTKVWRTEAQWEAITISGLQCGRAYKFGVVAKNGDDVETTYLWGDLTMSAVFTTSESKEDGTLSNQHAVYATARDATTAPLIGQIYVGQDSTASGYTVMRPLLQFPLPEAMSAISACTLYVYGYTNQSTTDFEIYIHGANAYRPTIAAEDFDQFDGWTAAGAHVGTILNDTWNSSSYSATWNKIVFNAAGLDSVLGNAPDSLAIVLISKEDFDNSAPAGVANVQENVAFYENTNVPYLSFTYTPLRPTGMTVTALTTDSLLIVWDDNSADEDSFLVRDSSTGDWLSAVAAGVETKRLGGLTPNSVHSILVEIKGGVGDGLQSYPDSSYTLAAVPGASTITYPTTAIMKIVLNMNSNPSHTKVAIQDSISGKYIHMLSGGVADTLRVAEDWQTYATWGSAAGCSLAVTPGKEYRIRVKARNTAN